MSWEFLFFFNLSAVFAIPLGLLVLRNLPDFSRWIFVIGAYLCPSLLGLTAYRIEQQGDIDHYLWLVFLQWTPTYLGILILRTLFEEIRLWKIYGCIFLSAGIGLSLFLATPPMIVSDPLLGVVPGPFSMDAIIDLNFFTQRAAAFALSLGIVFMLGFYFRWRPLLFILALWAVPFAWDQLRPGAFTLRPFFESNFEEPFQSGSFHIFIQKNAGLESSAAAWAKELQFHEQEILKRLPQTPQYPTRFDIFIYKSDEEKYRLIGARRVQIGNFLRSEMHLSSVTVRSEILRHELVHLIHGYVSAPVSSFLDPLVFEGLAVALTAPSLEDAIEDAAAVSQSQHFSLMTWPLGARFFSDLPYEASYQLSGGFAAFSLQQNQWPWVSTPELRKLKEMKVSADQIRQADELFKRPPLHKDPLSRDCQRLFRDFKNSPHFDFWNDRFQRACPKHQLLYRATAFLTERRDEALEKLAHQWIEARADLALIKNSDSDPASFYLDKTCRSATCTWKAAALQAGLLPQLRSLKTLDLKSILELQKGDPKALALLLTLQENTEALKSIEAVGKIRALNPDERFERLVREFYQSPETLSPSRRDSMKQELKTLAADVSEHIRDRAKMFEQRLQFE